ncbi:MAG: DMT family transporter [Rickettsiales bacterium]
MTPVKSHHHAIFWMLMTGFLAVSINMLARTLGTEFHPFQIVFFYNAFGLIFLTPVVIYKRTELKTDKMRLFTTRSILEFTAFSVAFYAVGKLPFPTFTALSFTSPLFASIFAIFILKEDNTVHRWIALLIGFIGVLIMTKPGSDTFQYMTMLVLAAACCFALCSVTIKKLTRTEPPMRVAFYMVFLTACISAPFAVYYWQPIPLALWPKLALMGMLVASVQYTVSRALSMGEVTAILPVTYVNLLWSSIYAYILFNETITLIVILGGGLIVAAAFYAAKFGHRKTPISDVVQA